MNFDYYEFEIAKKYRESRLLDEADRLCVEGGMSIGLYTLRVEHDGKTGNPQQTASLTRLGKVFLLEDEIERIPIINTLCTALGIFS